MTNPVDKNRAISVADFSFKNGFFRNELRKHLEGKAGKDDWINSYLVLEIIAQMLRCKLFSHVIISSR